jgi:hypothetical protein
MAGDLAGDGLMLPVPPALPADEVRAAIAADDWSLAGTLLAQHHEQLTAIVRESGSPLRNDSLWLDLLRQQNALLDELREARDGVEAAIARLNSDRRGANAWLRELA